MHTPLSRTGISDLDMDEVLRGGAPWWQRLSGARIMVTGATGWFGTWLLDVLVMVNREYRLGLQVVAVSRDPARFAARFPELHGAFEIEWLVADLRAPVADYPGHLTHVIHAATEASALLNRTRPDLMFETTVDGTRHALELARRGDRANFLLVSSGAIYGRQPVDLHGLAETWTGGPDPALVGNAYAEGKRAAEQLAAIAHARHGLQPRIARCFAFIGPHMPFEAHFAIGNFIANAVAGETVVVKSDGSPRRSWLYMTDLMVWLFAVLLDGQVMRPYNVGSEVSVTVGDAARRIAAACGVDCRIEGRPGESGDAYVPEIDRIVGELGVRRLVDLDEAIERTCRWRAAQFDLPFMPRRDDHG